ncbi:hypothetical protein [Flavisolibacter tropicus]|uniref:LVIVD repeat-containing protein n=1 Tax=Flavisolibacter tropicus TaxID=1492898 RepID=A0A172TUU0_9BACT|nr:hypothetical protein [Flavisolibacter tropicus]ANE50543.1 hypothetical protein SY85_08545 [Flavisolibacter tropicus]
MSTIRFFSLFTLIAFTFYSCTKESNTGADTASIGKGGSLARFTIVGNYLYIADQYTLEVYDISSPKETAKKSSVPVGFNVETIFPYKDKLFIGSSQGMYIYSLQTPEQPQKLGEARHVRSCDPVVANDSIAYVTLRGGTPCGAATDGLYTYNVSTITAPVQRSLLPLSTPYGLGLKDSVVFVCRGSNGLTAVNAKKAESPKEMYTLKDGNYQDVIPYDNLLICYVSTGIILYDISNLNQLIKLGTYAY